MNESLTKVIENLGVVPVIVINDVNKSEKLAEALLAGGIPCAEVTFRTPAAEESIRRISKAHPEMIVGAGTVVTVEQAERAVKAGARFLVSPGYDQNLVDWANVHDVPYYPGVCTASEVQVAVAHGFKVLKFFPAESSGGVKMIKDLCGPFPQVKFMTTGGISASNLSDYASCPNVIAVGGSWMAKSDMIENEEWDMITGLCRKAVVSIHGFSFAHLGINTQSKEDALCAASKFSLFGFETKVGNSSTFMDTCMEICHSKGRGAMGHIAIRTYNVERAVAYLSLVGFTADVEKAKYDEKGRMKIVYLNEEIGGFAVHLVK